MSLISLPRTAACIVCGPANPHGLRLTSHVDPDAGTVHTPFTPGPHQVGFDGLVHGGVLATVADEAMVWAAIWASRRACVAGELNVRFRRPTKPGDALAVVASVVRSKGRLIEAVAAVSVVSGQTVLTASGKYLAASAEETAAFFRTLVPETAAEQAVAHLRG